MPFGVTNEELAVARAAAVLAAPNYSDLQGDELARFMKNPWNDHMSVQSAIWAIRLYKEAQERMWANAKRP